MIQKINVFSPTVIQDQQNVFGGVDVYSNYLTASDKKLGQSFTTIETFALTSVDIFMSRVLNPAGIYTLKIYSDNAGAPGTLLATSDKMTELDFSDTPSTGIFQNWAFTNVEQIVVLSSQTKYHLVLDMSQGSPDGSNYFAIGYQNTNVYSGGNLEYFDGSSWNQLSTYDMAFRIYSNTSIPGSVQVFSESADPSPAIAGLQYFNTTTSKLRVFDGSSWADVGGGGGGGGANTDLSNLVSTAINVDLVFDASSNKTIKVTDIAGNTNGRNLIILSGANPSAISASRHSGDLTVGTADGPQKSGQLWLKTGNGNAIGQATGRWLASTGDNANGNSGSFNFITGTGLQSGDFLFTTGDATNQTGGFVFKAGASTFRGEFQINAGNVLLNYDSTSSAVTALQFQDSNALRLGFKAPLVATQSVTWELPGADGTAGQALVTNGSAVLSWATVGGGGGANTALSNLASTAVNVDLNPQGDGNWSLGGAGNSWNTATILQLWDDSGFKSVDVDGHSLHDSASGAKNLDYGNAGYVLLGPNGPTQVSSADLITWHRYQVSYTSFSASSTTNDVQLFSLLPNMVIEGVIITPAASFTGTGLTGYTVSVGISGNLTKYAIPFDVTQNVGAKEAYFNMDVESFTSSKSIRIAAASSGINLDGPMTAGSVYVWVKWGRLP